MITQHRGETVRYWLLTWNPRTFHLDELRRSGGELRDWRIRRFRREVREGDKFALWRSGRGGITAVGHITGEAEFKDAPSAEYWAEEPERAWFVPLMVDSWHDCEIPFKTLRDDMRFEGMAFRKVPGASNPHPLSEAHWSALMSYL
ncbi:EVE domain-containing protein [Thermopolyspora sp. NPDC052614]|uniref:EVE domain-containing protein n=1 Tax=Thermopolyspora sp. NPDC052614 TaxID=3155682 RepID=UPI0034256C9C